MNTIHLNIGLNVAGVETLQMPQIAVALEQCLPAMQITESYIRQSSTERTACIIIRWAGSDRDLHAALMPLCDLLSQEAIAARFFGADRGQADMLVGPKAAEWGGTFNPDYWLVPCPDNAPCEAAGAICNIASGPLKRDGWHIAITDGLHGYFERESDGTGGGLWYSRENPETGIEDGFLHLIDYDGVYALPRPVLVALRLAGVVVSEDCM